MRKELVQVKNKIKKLNEKKALIDEELEPLYIREEELENEEIISICRKNNITIEELIASTRRDKGKNGGVFGTGEKQGISKNTMMNKEKNDENK